MSVRSLLITFNKCFLICGLGSINYNQGSLKTTMILYIIRFTMICFGLKSFYNANHNWSKHFDPDMFDVTSLVMMCFYETIYIGRVLPIVWRLFFDHRLSKVLIKLGEIHDKLIRLNVVQPTKIKINWFFIFGLSMHFIANNLFTIYWVVLAFRTTDKLISPVSGVFSNICVLIAFYEYILIILYIKWMVHIINEQIPKSISTISTYRDLYLNVIECLHDINRSINGLPAFMSYIAANVGTLFLIFFYKVMFTENNDTKDAGRVTIIAIISHITLLVRTFNIIVLYGIGHNTAYEINRMSLVLHQRSLIERNPRIKRQIKFFILRRYHEHFHFTLCGMYEINLRQLLSLANKVIAYFVIQMLFKLNKK